MTAISPTDGPAFLGESVDTGAVLTAGRNEYAVVFGLAGTRENPALTVAFRDSATSMVVSWDTTVLSRAADGNISGKRPDHSSHRFDSSQLPLGPGKLLDVGVFSGSAQRITVGSEGKTSDAAIIANGETGWTLFWVVRDGKPLPQEAYLTAHGYSGPGSITVTAYAAGGNVLGTATSKGPVVGEELSRLGGRVQAPIDDEGRPTNSDPEPAISTPS
ncbi:hypothetical protein [Asanoa siamensis]|uniref:hypothetical protein n=1 Tax=Asanoa siamensis TaxID=926357 RepID=UPI001942361D|nr:hypothetical protein [Asanoa siamensis]